MTTVRWSSIWGIWLALASFLVFDFGFHGLDVTEPIASWLHVPSMWLFLAFEAALLVLAASLSIALKRRGLRASTGTARVGDLICAVFVGFLAVGHGLIVVMTVLIKTGVARS